MSESNIRKNLEILTNILIKDSSLLTINQVNLKSIILNMMHPSERLYENSKIAVDIIYDIKTKSDTFKEFEILYNNLITNCNSKLDKQVLMAYAISRILTAKQNMLYALDNLDTKTINAIVNINLVEQRDLNNYKNNKNKYGYELSVYILVNILYKYSNLRYNQIHRSINLTLPKNQDYNLIEFIRNDQNEITISDLNMMSLILDAISEITIDSIYDGEFMHLSNILNIVEKSDKTLFDTLDQIIQEIFKKIKTDTKSKNVNELNVHIIKSYLEKLV